MSHRQSRIGRVARIRVNPQDCMGIADVIEKLGLTQERFTFDQAVRIALSSLIESARTHGALPRRDGFEFSLMMGRFIERANIDRARTLEVTNLIGHTEFVRPVIRDFERDKLERRYQELALKNTSDEINMSESDKAELLTLTNVLFPDPDLANIKG